MARVHYPNTQVFTLPWSVYDEHNEAFIPMPEGKEVSYIEEWKDIGLRLPPGTHVTALLNERESMSKFKVGDKVKLVERDIVYYTVPLGTTGTVTDTTSASTGRIIVQFDFDIHDQFVTESALERVYSHGDRVKLIERDVTAGVSLGSFGTVVDDRPYEVTGRIDVLFDSGKIQVVKPSALEPITTKGENVSLVLRFDADVQVESSAISRLRYDSKNRALLVDFQSGGQGLYEGVPEFLWVDLLTAKSKGKFLNQSIKGRYSGRSLDEVQYHRWDEPAPEPVHKFAEGDFVLTVDGYSGKVASVRSGSKYYGVLVVTDLFNEARPLTYAEHELVAWDQPRRLAYFQQIKRDHPE